MDQRLALLQCPGCRGSLVASPGHAACQACGAKYPVVDGNIIDFVGGKHATQLDPAHYDHGIDDQWAFTSYDRICRCLAERWPASLGSVVEIGCGSGAFSRAVLSRAVVRDIVLTDVSVDMLRICSRHLERLDLASRVPTTLATYSTAERCFPDASFDTCVGVQVLHHIPDVNGFLAEALRFLKPGGRALFVEPNRIFIRAVASALADIVARLLAHDARPTSDRQSLLNWIAQARQGVLHQGDMEFLAAFEDKHMFVGEEFEQAALQVGFATAEALPATPDPSAADFVGSLLGALGISREAIAEVVQMLPEFAAPYITQLDRKDISQSYVFWLAKGMEQRAYRPPPTTQSNRKELQTEYRPGGPASDDGPPPRWHIEVKLDAVPDAVTVNLSGWCLLTTDVRWIRARINELSRDAAVWRPRADVHLVFNQSGSYVPWNSLCCGVTADLRFDGAAAQGTGLSFSMQIILMDGAVLNMRLPPSIQLGETFLLVSPDGASDADATGRPSADMSVRTISAPQSSDATRPQVPPIGQSSDQPLARSAPAKEIPMPGAFKLDAVLPALWTDRPNWVTQLRALAATGFVNQTEADQLAHFADHGWLLMQQAIEPALIDDFVSDIRNLYQKPGMFASTDFRGGRSQKLNGNRPDDLESLYDLYVNLQSSRRVCMHPKITHFLSLVFQSRVLAFQQLLFQRTNGHQWHQDTAYVVVDTPTFMAATWIALQDIVEGSGELAYYDRSHRLPHYMFSNGTTKHQDGNTDGAQYIRDLEEACQSRQLAYGRLLAKKGDVFFWTADLVHRSHPRTLPPETPRMSCVTHYCPATSMPHWFSDHEKRGIEPCGDAGGFASSFYKLPNLGKPIRPEPRWEFYN